MGGSGLNALKPLPSDGSDRPGAAAASNLASEHRLQISGRRYLSVSAPAVAEPADPAKFCYRMADQPLWALPI